LAKLEKRSLSDLTSEMLNEQIAERQRLALVTAAQALMEDYQTDTELIAFVT